jgi:dephospho-CoA kinase
MKKIIGVIGEMASGKDTFCEYVKENYENVFVFRFSDALTDVLKIFFDSVKREDQQWISSALRQRFGEDILVKALIKKVKSVDEGIVILNGVRRPGDFEALNNIGGKLVYVTAEPKIRWERVILRKEKSDDDVPFEKFLELGRAEAESQIPVIGARASFKIENNGAKEDFYQEVKKIIETI